MKIYVVSYADYDEYYIDSLWDTHKLAIERADYLSKISPRKYEYDIEIAKLNSTEMWEFPNEPK